MCETCGDTKEIVICGWCHWGLPHSSCDDTWRNPCPICCPDYRTEDEKFNDAVKEAMKDG